MQGGKTVVDSGSAQDIPGGDDLLRHDVDPLQIRIRCPQAAPVVNGDGAIPGHRSGERDGACRRCSHRRAGSDANVDAPVPGVPPLRGKRPEDCAVGRLHQSGAMCRNGEYQQQQHQ
jgi:hypothetical protein